MFFDKYDITIIGGNKVVNYDKLIERISNSIKENLAYELDYHDGLKVDLEDAEELLLELYKVKERLK